MPDRRILPGILALAVIALLVGGAFAGLVAEGLRDGTSVLAAFDSYLVRVARFTLWQAALSTILSVLPALFVARALARHPRFPGRGLILRLFAVPLALPAIVAALGVLALYGRAGYLADVTSAVGLGRWPGIYGLAGILVAHVFFNLPLATRLFLDALGTIPADHWRLAAQLGMPQRTVFRFLEWPAMRASLPGVAALVFMLCVTSFTIVLMLGGGPAATTLEVAIYQALRFDFAPAEAVALTLLQVAMTAAIVFAIARLGGDPVADANLAVARRQPLRLPARRVILDAGVILVAALFVLGPMLAILASGLRADLGRLALESSVHQAVLTSLAVGSLAALLTVLLSFGLVSARRRLELKRRGRPPGLLERWSDSGASLVLVVPPIVIGAGWFILLRHTGAVFSFAAPMIVAVNAVMAMPFAMRAIRPTYDAASERHERLCQSLGIAGLDRFRLVDWPVLRRALATGFAFAMALSLGDLGVVALFGSDAVQTLPYLLYQRMGSYRTADAAGLALLLALLCLALMLVADRLSREPRR